MKLYLIGKKELNTDAHTQIALEYYLTEEIRDSRTSFALYGVEVKKETRCQNHFSLEKETALSLSYSKDTVETLAQVLLENAVTPISLFEVIDDYISKEGLFI